MIADRLRAPISLRAAAVDPQSGGKSDEGIFASSLNTMSSADLLQLRQVANATARIVTKLHGCATSTMAVSQPGT